MGDVTDYPRAPRSAAEASARLVGERHGGDKRAALGEIAARLGHQHLGLHRTRSGRFFCSCDCGWVSTTRLTDRDALGAARHHCELAIRAWHRTGLPLPADARPVVRPEAEMRRRNRHYDTLRRAEEKAGAGSVAAVG
jgi:hypothetical protein